MKPTALTQRVFGQSVSVNGWVCRQQLTGVISSVSLAFKAKNASESGYSHKIGE